MTVKGGTTPACAACKYQRRKCSPTCPLAPYFPANQTKMFQNVHRLFGVSNVTKTLKTLKTKDQKEDAMRSIIYEADMRERFPVHGCLSIIQRLGIQLRFAEEELRFVTANIDACREQIVAGNKPTGLAPPPPSLDPWIDYASNDMATPQPQYYGVGQFLMNENGDCLGLDVGKPDTCSDTMSNNLSSIQTQMDAFGIHSSNRNHSSNSKRNVFDFECHHEAAAAMFDDRRSYIESKTDAFDQSSPESSLEDAEAEHGCRRGGGDAAENECRTELRTAAAGFSLTTVN